MNVRGIILAVFAGLLCSCVTKSKANAQAHAAFIAGRQRQLAATAQADTTGHGNVTFVGEVKNRVIEWSDDLTLGQALVEAEYIGSTAPTLIRILRQGKSIYVQARHLLNGSQNPLLQAGDVVDMR